MSSFPSPIHQKYDVFVWVKFGNLEIYLYICKTNPYTLLCVSKIKNIMKGKIEKVVNKNGDGGWFINNIPLHTDDIDKFVNYQNGKLIHKYENKEVEYYTEEFNHHFYGKLEVVRLVV